MTADAVGGVWPYALDLARGFGRRGIEVLLAVTGDAPSPTQRRAAAAIPGVSVAWAPYRLEWMADADADLETAGDWLSDLARRFEPDLVHLNGYAHADRGWPVPVVVVAHSCVRTWWRAVHGEDPPPAWDAYVNRVRCALDAADMIIAPTAAFLAVLTEAYGPPPAARVVANGRTAPAPVGCGRKDPQILCAARLWDEAKNVKVLNSAATGVPWPICVAGSTERPDGAPPWRFRHLRLLGSLEETALRAELERSAIFASPALYEPFGLAVLEAAQSGCALVLSDIPTFRDLWEGAALFVTPRDPGAWARALADLCADPAEVAALGVRARMRAQHFTPEAMVEGTLAAYDAAAIRAVTTLSGYRHPSDPAAFALTGGAV